MSRPIDYESRTTRAHGRTSHVAHLWLILLFLVVNLLLLKLASTGGGTFVAIILGPAANLVVAAVTLAMIPGIEALQQRDARAQYVVLEVLLPIAAIAIDFAVIVQSDWLSC